MQPNKPVADKCLRIYCWSPCFSCVYVGGGGGVSDEEMRIKRYCDRCTYHPIGGLPRDQTHITCAGLPLLARRCRILSWTWTCLGLVWIGTPSMPNSPSCTKTAAAHSSGTPHADVCKLGKANVRIAAKWQRNNVYAKGILFILANIVNDTSLK